MKFAFLILGDFDSCRDRALIHNGASVVRLPSGSWTTLRATDTTAVSGCKHLPPRHSDTVYTTFAERVSTS